MAFLDYLGDDEEDGLAQMAAGTIQGTVPNDFGVGPMNPNTSPQAMFTPNEDIIGGPRSALEMGTPIGGPNSKTSVPDIYKAFGVGQNQQPGWQRELTDALSVALPAAAGGIHGWKTGEGYGAGSMAVLPKSFAGTLANREKENQALEAQKLKIMTNPALMSAYAKAKKTADSGMFDQTKTFNDLLNEELAKMRSGSDQTPFQKDFEYYSGLDPDKQKKFLELKAANKLTMGPMDIPNYNLRVGEAEERKRRFDEDQKRKNEEFINKQVERYKDKIGNAQDAINNLSEAESIIAESTGNQGFRIEDYDPKTKTVNGKSINLPGVQLPGVGQVSFYSENSRKLDQTLQKLFNLELKNRSGVAVTPPELIRLKNEFAQGKFATEPEKIEAIQRYKRALFNFMQNSEAGYNPEAISTYEERGGQSSKAIKLRQKLPPPGTFSDEEIDAEIQRKINEKGRK